MNRLDGAERKASFLLAHPECAGWTVEPLGFASRSKKGVLGAFHRAQRWCRANCAGAWEGSPQAFAFADPEDGAHFRVAQDAGQLGGA